MYLARFGFGLVVASPCFGRGCDILLAHAAAALAVLGPGTVHDFEQQQAFLEKPDFSFTAEAIRMLEVKRISPAVFEPVPVPDLTFRHPERIGWLGLQEDSTVQQCSKEFYGYEYYRGPPHQAPFLTRSPRQFNH